ncbi:hypothetical protein QZH41_004128 [Actinostola sp. cb2023]|nr:hypothetical protein QZH41_004128 [Actinostola sp. cb2023]
MSSGLDKLVGNLKKEQFINTSKFFEGEELDLLLRKGVYPYDYMNCLSKLDETALPQKEEFFSKLNDADISDENYQHAQNVWKVFEMNTMRDYHNLYLLSDVLLLMDTFEAFRDVCIKNYKLDPCWYYTAPRFVLGRYVEDDTDPTRTSHRCGYAPDGGKRNPRGV